jgi:hypothetical protein
VASAPGSALVPAVVKIDPQRRVVCSTFYGEVKGEDLVRHRSSIAEDPDFDRDFCEIVDFSDARVAAISADTLRALANTPSLFNESVLHIVVTPGEAALALARNYQSLARSTRPNLVVVRTLDEAYEVLKSRASERLRSRS